MSKPFAISYDDSIFLDESDLKHVWISNAVFKCLSLEDCLSKNILPIDYDEKSRVLTTVVASPVPVKWLRDLQQQQDIAFLAFYRADQLFIQKYLMHLKKKLSEDVATLPPHIIPIQDLLSPRETSPCGIVFIVDPNGDEAKHFDSLLNHHHIKTSLLHSAEELEEFIQQQEAALFESDELFEPSQNNEATSITHMLVEETVIAEGQRATFVKRIQGLMPHTKIKFFDNYASLLIGGFVPSDASPTVIFNEKARYQSNLAFFLEHHDYYHASLELIKQGDLIQAVGILKNVPEADNNYRNAQYILGKAFIKKKTYKNAVECFNRALDPNPSESRRVKNLKILFHLGLVYEKMNQYAEALSYYERVFADNNGYRDVVQRLDRCRKEVANQAQVKEKREGVTPFNTSSSKSQNRYEILEEIGRGGMGVIYRARDTSLDREVALKVLSSSLKNDSKVIATFIREAKSCAALNHINIVTVYDAGIDENGNYFIAMEFIRGKTIRDILKVKQKFSISSVAKICKQVCRGLRYAHHHKIVHRDLTTNNMMLTENRIIKIMDFGLARIVEHLHSEQSIIGGTPFFMSPEQVEGASIDHRTDIYSLGVCLFEIATGRVPFPGENPGYHHVHTPPPDPTIIEPEVSEWLKTIILKCMEKKPESRFQDVDEVLDLVPSDL